MNFADCYWLTCDDPIRHDDVFCAYDVYRQSAIWASGFSIRVYACVYVYVCVCVYGLDDRYATLAIECSIRVYACVYVCASVLGGGDGGDELSEYKMAFGLGAVLGL